MKGKRYESKRGDDSNFSSSDMREVTMLNQVTLLQETQKKNEEKIAEMQVLLEEKTGQLEMSMQRLLEIMEQTTIDNDQKFKDNENIFAEFANEVNKKTNASDMEKFIMMAINKCNENTDKKLGKYLGINIAKEFKDEDNSMMIDVEANKRKLSEGIEIETNNKENGGNQIKCLTSTGRSVTTTRRSSATRS
jgi:hypothetical protein